MCAPDRIRRAAGAIFSRINILANVTRITSWGEWGHCHPHFQGAHSRSNRYVI